MREVSHQHSQLLGNECHSPRGETCAMNHDIHYCNISENAHNIGTAILGRIYHKNIEAVTCKELYAEVFILIFFINALIIKIL